MAKFHGFPRILLAGLLASATLIGIAPNAIAGPVVVAPLANSANSGVVNFTLDLSDVPQPGTLKITFTNVSDTSIERVIFLSYTTAGTHTFSIDPLAPDSHLLSSAPSAIASVTRLGGSGSSHIRLPDGSYSLASEYYGTGPVRVITSNVSFISSAAQCSPGTFSSNGLVPNGGTCQPAVAGKYVPVSASSLEISCTVGTYQDLSGQSSCKPARANHYAHLTGMFSDVGCPTGYTSPAGSDASTDCIAPVVSDTPVVSQTTTVVATPVTKAPPTLAKGKKIKIKTLATQIEMSIPAKSKVSAKVAKSSKKICKVSGTSIKALKVGSCVVTVKVKPKKGSATTKATTITVN